MVWLRHGYSFAPLPLAHPVFLAELRAGGSFMRWRAGSTASSESVDAVHGTPGHCIGVKLPSKPLTRLWGPQQVRLLPIAFFMVAACGKRSGIPQVTRGP